MKMDSKSTLAIFVGYSTTSYVYKFWNPFINKIIKIFDYKTNEALKKYTKYFLHELTYNNYVYIPINNHIEQGIYCHLNLLKTIPTSTLDIQHSILIVRAMPQQTSFVLNPTIRVTL